MGQGEKSYDFRTFCYGKKEGMFKKKKERRRDVSRMSRAELKGQSLEMYPLVKL